jgi:ribosomal protein S18 acetylase RimI-like enzyme
MHPISCRAERLITLIGLLSLLLFLVFYDSAFPSAAIDLALSRAEITQHAKAYLQDRRFEVEGYEFALAFTGNWWASYYLQLTLGIPKTNQLIRETGIPIWYWRARWFRPLQKEEYRVYLSPGGEVVALSHTLLEDALGESLSQEQALALAQDYLSEDRGWDLAAWEEVSASSEDRPGGRTDHTFVWKQRAWDVGESELRLAMTVQGDEVGYYNYWLKVPEGFQRDFSQQRNVAGFINGFSFGASFVLLIIVLGLALWKARAQIPASFSAALGPAVAVGVVVLLARANELPLAKAWYDTTEDYALFWLGEVSSILSAAFFNGIMVLGLWYFGQWLSKRVWPWQDRVLSRRGDRFRLLARSGWRGLMLGSMMAGYVVLFYLVATQLLGGWTPMGPNYTSAYATPLPFLGALETGLLPAMWEELMFRLLLISGVLWLTRSFTRLPEPLCQLLALLVPGALWGFAHLSYVRDPLYLRGVELTLAAILLEGLFFLRFDLTTTIVAHFAYNAGLSALPLLRSEDPYFVMSGLVVIAAMLTPVVPHLVRMLRHRLRGGTPSVPLPEVRLAVRGDREALAALPLDGLDWAALIDDPEAVVLCLQAAEHVVGVAAGQIAPETGVQGQVLAVYVAPVWRRRYWGSELLDALRTYLQERGAEEVCVTVRTDDKIGMRFMSSQVWKPARVTLSWPPSPPVLPSWQNLLAKLGLRRKAKPQEIEDAGQSAGE